MIKIKQTMYISLALLFFFFFTLTIDAHAGYLDPGSGSSFVQTIISIFAFFGKIINKIKAFFGFKTYS